MALNSRLFPLGSLKTLSWQNSEESYERSNRNVTEFALIIIIHHLSKKPTFESLSNPVCIRNRHYRCDVHHKIIKCMDFCCNTTFSYRSPVTWGWQQQPKLHLWSEGLNSHWGVNSQKWRNTIIWLAKIRGTGSYTFIGTYIRGMPHDILGYG